MMSRKTSDTTPAWRCDTFSAKEYVDDRSTGREDTTASMELSFPVKDAESATSMTNAWANLLPDRNGTETRYPVRSICLNDSGIAYSKMWSSCGNGVSKTTLATAADVLTNLTVMLSCVIHRLYRVFPT